MFFIFFLIQKFKNSKIQKFKNSTPLAFGIIFHFGSLSSCRRALFIFHFSFFTFHFSLIASPTSLFTFHFSLFTLHFSLNPPHPPSAPSPQGEGLSNLALVHSLNILIVLPSPPPISRHFSLFSFHFSFLKLFTLHFSFFTFHFSLFGCL